MKDNFFLSPKVGLFFGPSTLSKKMEISGQQETEIRQRALPQPLYSLPKEHQKEFK